jgi:hypothetical protein
MFEEEGVVAQYTTGDEHGYVTRWQASSLVWPLLGPVVPVAAALVVMSSATLWGTVARDRSALMLIVARTCHVEVRSVAAKPEPAAAGMYEALDPP